LQARADFSDRYRPAEAEALHRMDGGRAQKELLVGRFHALRRNLHAETLTIAWTIDGNHIRALLRCARLN
jgi:hypothetical protein